VDEWENIKDKKGLTILEKFYSDQEKYAFSFQMMAYISRLKLLKDAFENNNDCIIITERSLLTDKMVFAQMLYDNKKIEDINYIIYLKWFETFIENYPLEKIIYIKCNPSICLKRINNRSRQGENNIPIEYLTECHLYHEKMMDQLHVNKLILDGDIDIYYDDAKLQEFINTIENFIQT
jgi:deoxyadenosine/deoxycytidine kinase